MTIREGQRCLLGWEACEQQAVAAQRAVCTCNEVSMHAHAHDLSNGPTTHLRREFHYLKWAGPQVRQQAVACHSFCEPLNLRTCCCSVALLAAVLVAHVEQRHVKLDASAVRLCHKHHVLQLPTMAAIIGMDMRSCHGHALAWEITAAGCMSATWPSFFLVLLFCQVAILGMDMRSQRTKDRIMPQASSCFSSGKHVAPRQPASVSSVARVAGCWRQCSAVG